MNATLRNTVMALVATSAVAAGSAHAASWTNMHGISCMPYDAARVTNKMVTAAGLAFDEKAGLDNWVYCPVPTQLSQTTPYVVLQYFQQRAGSLTLLHLYSGKDFVRAVDVPVGVAGWNTVLVTMPATFFPYGLSVAAYLPNLALPNHYAFSDAGAYWQ